MKEKLKEIQQELEKIERNLRDKIHPFEISEKFKSPFKLKMIIEIQAHRIYDLGSTSRKLIINNDILSSLMVNRAILEGIAYLYYLLEKIERSLNEKRFEEADKYLMKVNFGGRDGLTGYESTNIMTAIEKANKRLDKIEDLHAMLSEYSHPNYAGCFEFYCEIDEDGMHHLSSEKTDLDRQLRLAIDSLTVGLGYFSIVYEMYQKAVGQVLEFYQEHYEE